MLENSFKKLYSMLSRGEKRLFYISWALMFLSGVTQVLGIASVMPFISVAANREMIQENKYLRWVYTFFNFESDLDFLIFLGSAVVVFTIFANGTVALTRFVQARFITRVAVTVQRGLLQQYLHKPYTFFLKRNTAKLAKTLLSETRQVTNGILLPGIEMLNQAVIAFMILILLLIADPALALISIGAMGGLFGTIYYFIRKQLRVIGRKRVYYNGKRYKAAQEALSGIKEIKLLGKENAYIGYFARPVRHMFKLNEKGTLYQQIPPIMMQVLVMLGIMGLILYLLITIGDLTDALPKITLFALGAFKLKPSIQTVFSKWSTVKYQYPALENVMEDMEADEEHNERVEKTAERLPLKKAINVFKLTFSYPNSHRPALQEVSLTIPANTSVAFVGPTGSGKSSLVDNLLGLLRYQEGTILVDGVPLKGKNWRKWQNNIGYIPQHIYLTDDTVAANIAFGIAAKDIDMDQVVASARAAHLHDFIQELPDAYHTEVGERGVRLSGGQRQRLGIARALYSNPDVLVMDEATSALDNITERAVMEAIDELAGSKTVLMIAHRLSTVINCDQIYLLEKGRITDQGSYAELLERSPYFKKLALEVQHG